MSLTKRLTLYCLPSFVAAFVAACVIGVFDIYPTSKGVMQFCGTLGFLVIGLGVLGFVASLILRLAWLSWNTDDVIRQHKLADGTMPWLFAWVLSVDMAAIGLGGGLLWAMVYFSQVTKTENALIVIIPVFTVTMFFIFVALSKPIASLLFAFGNRLRRYRWGRFFLRPIGIAMLGAGGIVLFCCVIWITSYGERLQFLNLERVWLMVLFTGLLIGTPLLWHRLSRNWQWGTGVSLIALCLLLIICARVLWTVYPSQLLASWGDTRWSGLVIEKLTNLREVRRDMKIDGVNPISQRGAEHPSVVIISIDTLRADRLSLHGGPVKMPNIESFAKSAALFKRAFAPGNVTRRSLPSLVTGLSPARIRGRVIGWGYRMDPRHILLAERFKAAEYTTAGFFCCESIFGKSKNLGLERGFDTVQIEKEGDALSTMAKEWLQTYTSDAPVFLWVHLFDPHQWKANIKSKAGLTNKDRYDENLRATDAHVKRILDAVTARLGEDTVIVLTSDHGEGLGDHGMITHGSTLYDSEIQVPLIIKGKEVHARRVQKTVSLVDVAPTLLELAGFVAPSMPSMDGKSFSGLLRGLESDSEEAGEAYARTIKDHSVKKTSYAFVSGRYKLISYDDPKRDILFDTIKDPKETKNLKTTKPKI